MKKLNKRLMVAGLALLPFAFPEIVVSSPEDKAVKQARREKIRQIRELIKETEDKEERKELKQLIKDVKTGAVSTAC